MVTRPCLTARSDLQQRRHAACGGRALVGALVCAILMLPAIAAPGPRDTLVVAAYPAVDAIVRDAIPAWHARHPDIDIEVISRQFVDHHTAMTTALSTASYLPDVMALEVGYVGRFARGHGLEDLSLPPYSASALASRFVPYAFRQGIGPAGNLAGLPSDIGPGTLLYRNDVLMRAGVTPAELIRSWDSYIAAGRRIKSVTGAYLVANARDIKDILIRSNLAPGEGLYYDRESRVLVQSPRFVRAFELARLVRRDHLDARVTAWSNDWSEGFRRGTIATQMTGAWLSGHLANWLAPDTRGLWRAAPLPAGAAVGFGGTFLAIPRAAPAAHMALAWELVQLLTLDRNLQLQAFRNHDAFPALLAAHQDAYFDAPLPFLGGQPARQLWRQAALQIPAAEVHKQDAFAEEVINTELDKVLDQGKDVQLALADAAILLVGRAHR